MIPAPDSAPGSPLQARSRLLSACDWLGAARHREPSLRFERHDHHHPAPASPRNAATPTMFGDSDTDYPGMNRRSATTAEFWNPTGSGIKADDVSRP